MHLQSGMCFTRGGDRRTIGGRCREWHAHEGGLVMPSSAIIDLAIGLIFVFGVTVALASVFTELVSRFIGLRGAYLLTGLRELVDSGQASTDLGKAQDDYRAMRDLVKNGPAARAGKSVPSVTGALLGGPILGSQGMVGQIQDHTLTAQNRAAEQGNQ